MKVTCNCFEYIKKNATKAPFVASKELMESVADWWLMQRNPNRATPVVGENSCSPVADKPTDLTI